MIKNFKDDKNSLQGMLPIIFKLWFLIIQTSKSKDSTAGV